jgi:hypothetical protein
MSVDIGYHYLQDIGHRLRSLKAQADRALAQVRDEELFTSIDSVSNSVAVLMKHMAGNMVHNWTYPFAPDEEKPVRDREGEFEAGGDTKDAILRLWEEGWRVLLDAVTGFTEADLERRVVVRWREYTLIESLNRQLVHYAQHVGQIIFLAKHFRGEEWESLSIPKGQSEAYTERMRRERLPED